MKVSLNWLAELVKLPKVKPEELANKIAEHCFEVEKIAPAVPPKTDYLFSNIFVAKVLEANKHPNADRLQVVKVDLGSRGGIVAPVVCGANNFVVGDFVALALPEAFIPKNVHSDLHESYTLTKAKIRGVESQGMICSAFELGLRDTPEEKPEILVLGKNAVAGQKLEEYLNPAKSSLKSDDIILDVALPSNRPDLFSHFGIARELSTILGFKPTKNYLSLENIALQLSRGLRTKNKYKVSINNKKDCKYYIAVHMSVRVGATPDFMLRRLSALGLRSVNNIVDITNYLMLELGQPMHAFDYFKVSGGITVRNARNNEKITTLDHKERLLTSDMLVIADNKKVLALAGIMGGQDSEVTGDTQEIILEVANFSQATIRKTSKALGLRSDSSTIFEKGISIEQANIAANRAMEFFKKYAAAKILSINAVGQAQTPQRKIRFNAQQINNLIGFDFSPAEVKKLAQRVGLKISGSSDMAATLPYFRQDIDNYADIAEEILKITGFNDMQKQPLAIVRNKLQFDADKPYLGIKEQLALLGFSEVQNYSFLSRDDIRNFGLSENTHIKVKNPLSFEQEYLKKHLIIPMLKNVALNYKYFNSIKIFELSKVYHGYANEKNMLTFLLTDKNTDSEDLFVQAKSAVKGIFKKYGLDARYVVKGNVVEIMAGQYMVGTLDLVSNVVLHAFGINYPVVSGTLDADKLLEYARPVKYLPFNRLPRIIQDISAMVPVKTKWEDAEKIIKSANKLVSEVSAFTADVSKKEQQRMAKELAAKGKKNLLLRVVYHAEKRTLTDSEILPIHAKIIEELKRKLGAEIS